MLYFVETVTHIICSILSSMEHDFLLFVRCVLLDSKAWDRTVSPRKVVEQGSKAYCMRRRGSSPN